MTALALGETGESGLAQTRPGEASFEIGRFTREESRFVDGGFRTPVGHGNPRSADGFGSVGQNLIWSDNLVAGIGFEPITFRL